MNSCNFFGIRIVKGSSPVAVRQSKTQNDDLMVSFWGQEKSFNSYVSHMFKAFGDVAQKIVNMGLDEHIRVNIIASAEKYEDGKYSFKIISIDYADPKPKKEQKEKNRCDEKVDLSCKDPFSQLLPEDFNLI